MFSGSCSPWPPLPPPPPPPRASTGAADRRTRPARRAGHRSTPPRAPGPGGPPGPLAVAGAGAGGEQAAVERLQVTSPWKNFRPQAAPAQDPADRACADLRVERRLFEPHRYFATVRRDAPYDGWDDRRYADSVTHGLLEGTC